MQKIKGDDIVAGQYDGSIRIDSSINTAPIDGGISQIENKLKSLGAAVGLAFGVKELIDFGKRSVDAASDLAEAQNVVDTAFGDMSYKMEQFASTALQTYGISELTAKNMGSTYMAMAKGMGVATDAASDMAVTLTGRLSDIMSFYNKTQSEVDTIGRALITGETEPLKAIGVVMTQTNLSAYAMAQGFAKTYDEMSANEQLLVRYKYFLEQTSLAQGDFAKTSEGWANRTRILSEQINEFMTNLGGLIINTLTPALQFANEAVTFLNELFFGGSDDAEEATAAKSAEAVADEVTAVGTAADKSKKKLNNLLAGFDELHIISGANSGKDKQSATDAGIDTSNLLGVNLDADTSAAKKAAGKYRDIIDEIYIAFKQHPLTKAIGDIIKGIGEFLGIFEDDGKINSGKIVDTLMDILGAFLAFKAIDGVVGVINKFKDPFKSLISLILKYPIASATVAAAAGITALVIGIFNLADELQHQEIASQFGDIAISIEEIDELVSPIDTDINRIAKAFGDNQGKIKTSRDNFIELSKAIGATTDALNFSSTSDDLDRFTKQVDEYIDAALDFTNAKNDTSALKELYMSDGTIDDTEQSVLDSIENLNGDVTSKIEIIRAQIHSITQSAAEESRGLVESEIENIKKLYDELAQITSTQGDIEQTATWERLISRAYTYESYDELLDEITKAREKSEESQQEIEQALFEQMTSHIMDMRAKGSSEAEIAKFRDEFLESTNESLDQKKRESAEYELKLLDAWAEAHYGTTEDKEFEKLTAGRINYKTDEQKDRLKQYYELYKAARESGEQKDANTQQVSDLARNLDEYYYFEDAAALYRALAGADKTYGDWTDEKRAVVQSLLDLGDENEEFTSKFLEIVKGAKTIDGSTLLPDVSYFTGKGEGDGRAYINALSDYISKAAESTDWRILPDTGFSDKYFSGKYSFPDFSQSSYVQQSQAAPPRDDQPINITIPIEIDNETKETITARVNRTSEVDRMIISNGR